MTVRDWGIGISMRNKALSALSFFILFLTLAEYLIGISMNAFLTSTLSNIIWHMLQWLGFWDWLQVWGTDTTHWTQEVFILLQLINCALRPQWWVGCFWDKAEHQTSVCSWWARAKWTLEWKSKPQIWHSWRISNDLLPVLRRIFLAA